MGLAAEVAGTFILVFVIQRVSSRNLSIRYQALIVGFTLSMLIIMIGPLTGAGLNPVRSLGPATPPGYSENLWIYLAGPVAGAALAARIQKRMRGY